MFGHEDISVNYKAILLARFFQKSQEKVPTLARTELRLAMVAAAGNEMQVPVAVVAVQSVRHRIRVHTGVGTLL